ncbi:Hemin transport system permease protein HmuU [Zhongshania aliphaticivorans]|uniref:Hemin transport system permease protein HmuU n=1 Tax=Zhongshania aliphaticivorans TaxID=1470434 RepID=A0A5S9N6Q9_9GAMM|nr:iron chelate uptake ABC transporter family permease subunit [Zhongshania aliphaticivorans]CAA0080723.1 Hemin transport system permease protein HmuU [Zhongshania aliphaticivorans]CAA0085552.1 Hemin transport system permease protein HmuU [Zhongshania aliphaticivorans]
MINRHRIGTGLAALGLLLCTLAAVSLSIGQVTVDLPKVIAALLESSGSNIIDHIVVDIRLPRVLMAALAGAALGIAGVLMQTLFRNPMADAWSLGLTAGGQLGVAMAVAAAGFVGPAAIAFIQVFEGISLTLAAGLGVLLSALGMMALSRRVSTISLLVVGLMLGFSVQGLVSVIIHFANRVGGKVYSGWADGSFASATFDNIGMMMLPITAGIVLAVINAKALTTLLLGETYARSLGTDVIRLQRMTLLAVVLLVAPVTAYCGPITFLGLIVPHLARAISRSAHILPLLPLSALAGAVLALAADLVVHLPWDVHFLHLNAVLGIVGAPVVIFLLIFSSSVRRQT